MTTPDPGACIYTLGHSTHGLDHFLGLLKQYEIACVVDVRSMPYSKWQPQYNREALAASLKNNGLDYLFMGAELGARSDDRSCYKDGKVVYGQLAAAPGFKDAVQRLRSDSMRVRMALMCAEQEPLE